MCSCANWLVVGPSELLAAQRASCNTSPRSLRARPFTAALYKELVDFGGLDVRDPLCIANKHICCVSDMTVFNIRHFFRVVITIVVWTIISMLMRVT